MWGGSGEDREMVRQGESVGTEVEQVLFQSRVGEGCIWGGARGGGDRGETSGKWRRRLSHPSLGDWGRAVRGGSMGDKGAQFWE